jgi:hypothetical protein
MSLENSVSAKRRGRRPLSNHTYSFDELSPVRELSSGIGVYDRTSFPGHYEIERVGIPNEPQIIVVDRFMVQDPKTERYRDEGRQTVLTFHGISTPDYWRQFVFPHRDMEDILEEIEKEGIPLDVIAVCNPGRYKLPTSEGVSKYTYTRGTPEVTPSGYQKESGIVWSRFNPGDGRMIVKGEREYLGAITSEEVDAKKPSERRKIVISPNEL